MQQGMDNIDALLARSTLVPTAGEFVPRTFHSENTPRHHEQPAPSRPKENNDGSRPRRYYESQSRFYSESNSSPQGGRLWRDGDRSGTRSREPQHQNGGKNHENTARGQRFGQSDSYRGRYKSNNGERFKRQQNSEMNNQAQRNDDPPHNSSSYRRGYSSGPSRYYNNRQNGESGKKPYGNRSEKAPATEKNQLEVLVSQLTKGELECLVCYEHVKQTQATWSCGVCHHVLHLRCVGKWARSSRADQVWRCPACRHVFDNTPTDYLCFCGKVSDPVWNRIDCPHSCGGTCALSRADPCPHKCTLPCHPGPCPPCRLFISRSCGCGRANRTVQCSDVEPITCGSPCSRVLNCMVHKCEEMCHPGDCPPCSKNVDQVCFCDRISREVVCTEDSANITAYCCGETCDKQLLCGNHKCSLICHSGPCPPCQHLPENVTFCPCGQTTLSSLPAPPRVSCLEPVPTCSALCGKLLPCGEPGNRHQCSNHCHEGPCPVCPNETLVRCRCGHMNKTMPCSEIQNGANDVRCEKKCNKKRSCGKHKCREPCCIDADHICILPCTRTLSCGLHRCEEPCHSAYCRPCPRMSFDELLCECGAEVIFPPVPCGVRKPNCSRPCSRRHPCDHAPTHNCHSDPQCPPCTVLVAKRCHGGHEMRKAVPCHIEAFSCGLPCGEPMPCGRHTCILPCHAGSCLKDDAICTQACTSPRTTCGHSCGAPCHEAPCPEIPCKELVKVSCECGHRFSTRSCVDNAREYQRIATIQLASKMADAAAGQTVDLNICNRKISYKTLECTEECKIIERNRRMAVGLQIRNPDLSAKLTPQYSEFLRGMAKKDPAFCQMVHDKLTELVKLAKESKQKSRSYSFDPMKREKRQFIHEYCEHFGCESVAYDKEPIRNIVATALRDKSWLPGMSLLELVQRASGARKVPLPNNAKVVPTERSMEVLTARGSGVWSAWAEAKTTNQSVPQEPHSSSQSQSSPQIDYFSMTPL